jgi:YidC/Oxa1 family membrane protein insertase
VDFRRLLVASLLSLAVVLLWPVLFPSLRQVPPPAEEVAAPPAAAAVSPSAEVVPSAPPPTEMSSSAGVELPALAAPPLVAEREERVVVETPTARMEWTNAGAQLVSLVAKRQVSLREEQEELVRQRVNGPYPLAVVDAEGRPLDAGLYVVERERSADGEVVTFRLREGGREISKRFELAASGALRLTVEARGLAEPWGVWLGPGLRNPSREELDSQFSRRQGVYRQGAEVETVAPKAALEGVVTVEGGLAWVGLEDTYFLTALVGEPAFARVRFLSRSAQAPAAGGEAGDAPADLGVMVEASGGRLAARGFFGAKVLDRLEAEGVGLEETVRWGGWGFLAIPLLHGLEWIHANVVRNYGWAIVIMTFLIRLVLLPLTHKSYVSMQKMAALNPKMQAIRNAYRTKLRDKNGRLNLEAQQKMNQEIMALYQREGVNPMGGCLPLLLQFPVLLAFYSLLSTAVELRGAPWVGWVVDLAAKDPYYVLPIVMGATQFLQTKMTPMTGDPLQRKIFLAMPLVFTVLFLGFPSGLVLYWLTSNVLTILQTGIYNHYRKRAEA